MTAPRATRNPRVFATDDPALVQSASHAAGDELPGLEGSPAPAGQTVARPTAADLRRGIQWGGLLISAMAGLAALAASLSFARFVSGALERNDWIGWTATGLLAVAVASGAVLVVREIGGLWRLARLARLRSEVETALRAGDPALERAAVGRLKMLYRGRRDLRWGLARLADHERDVRDPGELMRLADRELLVPLDVMARRAVLASAKRVSVVTAMSPMVWPAMLFVIFENLRMLKGLAGLYGGRPGAVGAMRLARMVMTHIVATGGLAMTDDLLGQFLGQDLLRRLSRRLGEGAFNGALTARIGTAAIEVTRPLPFLDAEPVRVRDLLAELFRKGAPASQPVSHTRSE
ncbi:MAG TPA: TIGR01620 family protein [Alphaproteobacteria bacterium]|nr:TIGR01620 family protein [Alphaproteobacteria bacterium]